MRRVEERNRGRRLYLLNRPYIKNGEHCGPLVAMSDIEGLAWNDETLDDFFKVLEGFAPEQDAQELGELYDQAFEYANSKEAKERDGT